MRPDAIESHAADLGNVVAWRFRDRETGRVLESVHRKIAGEAFLDYEDDELVIVVPIAGPAR